MISSFFLPQLSRAEFTVKIINLSLYWQSHVPIYFFMLHFSVLMLKCSFNFCFDLLNLSIISLNNQWKSLIFHNWKTCLNTLQFLFFSLLLLWIFFLLWIHEIFHQMFVQSCCFWFVKKDSLIKMAFPLIHSEVIFVSIET